MLLDGEKYACDACVRGHRVSSCTHKDRKLNHVNKKGRPLTQCPHCRGLRKSRATHVKCECGELGHSRNSSVESAGDSTCQCRTGKKCTCALKKEPLDPVTAARRTIAKPRIPGVNSDSAVPKLKAPIFPPFHRGNTHGSDRGYTITQPRQNMDSLHMSPQRSTDHLRRPAPMPFQQTSPQYNQPSPQPASASYGPRQHGSPMQPGSMAHRRRAQLPALRINNQTQLPDFSESVDYSTLHKALSPGNPARYSFHGALGGMSHTTVAQPPHFLHHDSTDSQNSQSSNWNGMHMVGPYDAQRSYPNRNPMTPSDVSIDYSLSSQLGLSMSSSGTPSEPSDANGHGPDLANQTLPYRPLQKNGTYIRADLVSKGNLGLQEWQNFAPSTYAVSDPGEPASTWPMSNLDFALGDTDSDQFIDQTMNQYPMGGPMMTEEAVRDWVVEPPSLMQDPNIGHNLNYPPYGASLPQAMNRYSSNPGWN